MAETIDQARRHLYLATREGILAVDLSAEADPMPWALNGVAVTRLAADGKGVLLAALRADGVVLATPDGGSTWRESSDPALRARLEPDPIPAAAGAAEVDLRRLPGFGRGSHSHHPEEAGLAHPPLPAGPPERPLITALLALPGGSVRIAGAARARSGARPGITQGADAWLYRSGDGGLTWSEARIDGLRVLRGPVVTLLVAPRDSSRVFGGTTTGELFESRDGGLSYAMIAATLPGVLHLVSGPDLA